MYSLKHYSDEEIQAALDNRSVNDNAVFELHLKECDGCNKKFKAYSSIRSFLKYKVEIPRLEIDLVEAVMNKIPEKSRTHLIFNKAFNGLMTIVGLMIISICIKFLGDTSVSPGPIILFILFLGFHFLVSLKETRILIKRYSKLINI
ncbi:MAG: hypothetical protein NTX65_13695 [Ignavibacteriales bacterium]|nr:hypothetical protein [Ignavibacteriales bacterium]